MQFASVALAICNSRMRNVEMSHYGVAFLRIFFGCSVIDMLKTIIFAPTNIDQWDPYSSYKA